MYERIETMKKRWILIFSLILCLVLVPTVVMVIATTQQSESGWIAPTYKEMEATDADTSKGTLKYTVSDDSSTVAISYKVNGEKKTYTVPNNANYTSGGFAANDDLDRSLPNSLATGVYGSNGEFYVGLFYFLWMGEHGDSGVFDCQKIIDTYGSEASSLSCGAWGPVGAMHFFAEPLYGYYYSSDEWVIRKHMELIMNANVDFLYFDVTNGYPYINNAKKVMKVCHQLNQLGFDAPQVVFYTHTSSKSVIQQVYDSIYSQNLYPDTWFYVDGKPCIIADSQSYNINNFFTLRSAQWPNEPARTDTAWPWMDFQWPQRVFKNASTGVGESMSVSVAQHSGSVCFSSSAFYGDKSNRGRSCVGASDASSSRALTSNSYLYGYNFQNQWDNVFSNIEASATNKAKNVKYVLVTGWNEWVAQRQSSTAIASQPVYFIDTASVEFSRDVEMTRGYYFDNYYIQMIENVQKLKGSAPVIVQDARNQINVTGAFNQWDNVLITYKDAQKDCADRNASCFGNSKYTDTSGRNDIANAKVTSDSKNVYFYVDTVSDITMYDTSSSWMQLFVNSDNDDSNGWYGYDYIINYSAIDQYTTTVAKITMNSNKKYSAKIVGKVNYQVSGNKMMIAVPMEMLDIKGYLEVYLEYKWADADIILDTMEEFYTNGDAAPLGRLNWIYQNYIPGVSEVTYPDETVSTENAPTVDISILDIYKNATSTKGFTYNNYVHSAKLRDGYVQLIAGGEDTYVTLIPINSSVTVPGVIAIKYRTTSSGSGEFFVGSGSGWTGGTDEVSFNYTNDGEWHVKYINISDCAAVTNNKIGYLRYDFFKDGTGEKSIDIAYVSFFESKTKAKAWESQLQAAEEPYTGLTSPTLANEVTLEKILKNAKKTGAEYSNLIKFAELDNGYLNLVAKGNDPYVALVELNSSLKVPDVIAIKYRTISEGGGEFFIGSGNGWTGGTDEVKFDYENDGEWHILYVNIADCKAVTNNTISYLRYDFFEDGTGEKSIDIAYVGFFDTQADAPQ